MTTVDTTRPAPPELPHPPRRIPLVGDVLGFSLAKPLQSSVRQGRGLGPIFQRKIFTNRVTMVTGADLVEDLVDETRFEKHVPPALVHLRGIVGDGLFTAFNDEPGWQQAHDLLRPAFSQSAMRGYHEVMLDVAAQLTDRWDGLLDSPVDVAADMTKVTLETIGRTGFSYSFGSFNRETPHPFVLAMVSALTHSLRKVARPPAVGDLLMRHADRRHAQDVRSMFDLVEDVIRQRTRADTAAGPDDLLGLMLTGSENAAALDPVNVRNQIITFLVAGHETTSGALAFALYYLTKHPDVLRRAREEIAAVWGPDQHQQPAYEQIARLRYLRRVLDESLRLWPTVPAFARAARHDTVIGGHYPMAKGDWTVILVAALHRDSAWGPDADQFDPDRFTPERSRNRPAHLYRPFGTGERACIGRQFAVHEALLVLGTVLRRYDLTPDPSYVLDVSERLTLMPDGFTLTPRRRVSDAGAASCS